MEKVYDNAFILQPNPTFLRLKTDEMVGVYNHYYHRLEDFEDVDNEEQPCEYRVSGFKLDVETASPDSR